MMKTPRFLSVETVRALHGIAIEDQGGDPAVRDLGLLESALAVPQQQFGGEFLHTDIPAMAAAYAFHICQNHPFLDGNKRAGVAAMIAFLSDNGWAFDATADEAEPVVRRLASGLLRKDVWTDWARQHMHEKPSMELRVFFERLSLKAAHEQVQAGLQDADEARAHGGRIATMMEAARFIPAIHEANVGAAAAREAGQDEAAAQLHAMSHLLTAIYRVAEDMGYEW